MKSRKEESMKDTITIVWWCYQHDHNNDDVIITMISIVIKSLWWISSTKKFFWPHFRNEWSTVSKGVSTSYYHLPQCVHETLLCKLWRKDYCKYFLFDPIISVSLPISTTIIICLSLVSFYLIPIKKMTFILHLLCVEILKAVSNHFYYTGWLQCYWRLLSPNFPFIGFNMEIILLLRIVLKIGHPCTRNV